MESQSKSLNEVGRMEQCSICKYEGSCSRLEPCCAPCNGDGEERLTCNCLNTGCELRAKELEHEAR